MYLPKTAYEYSTLLLCLITIRWIEMTGTMPCITGTIVSSSSPSDTSTAASAIYSPRIFLTSELIFSSASMPRLYLPATTATCDVYPLAISSSYVLTAPKIALASGSSGSSIASLTPALIHGSLPTTGVSMPPLEPISSSRSTHKTRILLCVDAAEAALDNPTPLCGKPFVYLSTLGILDTDEYYIPFQ